MKFVDFGILRNGNVIFVGEFFELRFVLGVNDYVGEGGVGSLGVGRSIGCLGLGLEVCKVGVMVDRSDEFVLV